MWAGLLLAPDALRDVCPDLALREPREHGGILYGAYDAHITADAQYFVYREGRYEGRQMVVRAISAMDSVYARKTHVGSCAPLADGSLILWRPSGNYRWNPSTLDMSTATIEDRLVNGYDFGCSSARAYLGETPVPHGTIFLAGRTLVLHGCDELWTARAEGYKVWRCLHKGRIDRVGIDATGRTVAMANSESVTLIDIATGACLWTMQRNDYITGLAVSPTGIVAVRGFCSLVLLDGKTQRVIAMTGLSTLTWAGNRLWIVRLPTLSKMQLLSL